MVANLINNLTVNLIQFFINGFRLGMIRLAVAVAVVVVVIHFAVCLEE